MKITKIQEIAITGMGMGESRLKNKLSTALDAPDTCTLLSVHELNKSQIEVCQIWGKE